MMIKGTEENFHGTFKYLGNEKISANKSPENDLAEVGDVVEQKREQEFGHQKQACLSPEQERLPGEGWCFQVSSSCFQEQQSLLRNPSAKTALSKSTRASVWTNDLSSFLQGKKWIYKEATKGIKEAAEKAAKNLA